MSRRLFFGLGLLVSFALPLSAQARDSVSIDATLGPNVGWGGRRNYYNDSGIGGEITLGFRARPGDKTTRLGAFTVGGRTNFGFGDKCVIDPGPPFACRPRFPSIAHVGVLGGLERRLRRGSDLRMLVGPAFYGGGGASGAGGQLQVDAAAGFSHIALVAVARGNLVFRFSGETLRFGSLGFGLRVQ